ncbi:hypothetical protein KKE60_09000 [Patescibacteria group bacterium]|nr:hypothetical protein [Patescibacteria group bacterium]
MTKNGNGRYEFTTRTLMAIIVIATFLFSLGGAWVGQRVVINSLQDVVDENKESIKINRASIGNVIERQHNTDVQLARLTEAISQLTIVTAKLEAKVDAIR